MDIKVTETRKSINTIKTDVPVILNVVYKSIKVQSGMLVNKTPKDTKVQKFASTKEKEVTLDVDVQNINPPKFNL